MTRYPWILALALLAGCEDENTRALDQSVAISRQAVRAHHEDAVAGLNLPAMHRMEDLHAQSMMTGMARLERTAGRMEDCSMEMAEQMRKVRGELSQHRENMRAAPDLISAKDEEQRHLEAMMEAMDRLQAQAGGICGGGM